MDSTIELQTTYGFYVGKASYLTDEDVNFQQRKEVYQLILVLEGEVAITLINSKKELSERDCVFLGKNERFRFTAHRPYKLLYVQFNEEFYCRTELDRFFLGKCYFFENTKGINYINLNPEYKIFVHNYYGTLLKIYNRPHSEINYMLAHNTIERMLLYIISSNIQSFDNLNMSRLSPEELHIAVSFTKLLSEYAKSERNVRFYSDQINISVNKLTEVCKEVYGVTPKKLIVSSVINEAKLLLKHSSLMIKEVANELNFEDASNFIRFFLKATGLSPTEYRESL